MAAPVGPSDTDVVIKFGGGVNSRASEDEIDEREAASAKNLKLDEKNREYRNRAPFDLMGTAPNSGEIRGFITLTKSDGTNKLAVQAGTKVYEYDGLSTFTELATVSSSAKLRGRLEHQWTLSDKVLITDLERVETVKEWDGTTFQAVSFTNENGSGFGNFFAKYCFVDNERAVFANVEDASTATPHLIVGSTRGDYTQITVDQRAASALSAADPWFLISPDLRPVNGLVSAFSRIALSTQDGSFYQVLGSGADDFQIDELHPRSFASGDESVAYIGNDVVYGRQGKIESLAATDAFGDVSSNDVSLPIQGDIATYKDWTVVYNSRLDRVYFIPGGAQGEMWVLHKDLAQKATLTELNQGRRDLSPWMLWTTTHPMSFNPTCIMNVIDPQDGLEYTLMGDSSGNIYRLEGSGLSGDGGSSDITSEVLTRLYSVPVGADAFNINGYLKYRKGSAATVRIAVEWAGTVVTNEVLDVPLDAISDRPVYGGTEYYGGETYYGSAFEGRLTRYPFRPVGQSNEFQVRVTVTGTSVVEINEIGLRFTAAS